MKPIYQVIPEPHPVIAILDLRWYNKNEEEIVEWCNEYGIRLYLRDLYLNSIDEVVMFKLRFGV